MKLQSSLFITSAVLSVALFSCNGSSSSSDDSGGFFNSTSEAPDTEAFFFDGPSGSEIRFDLTEVDMPGDLDRVLIELRPDRTGLLLDVDDTSFPGLDLIFQDYVRTGEQGMLTLRLGSEPDNTATLARLNTLLSDPSSTIRRALDDYNSDFTSDTSEALEDALIASGLPEICVFGEPDPETGNPELVLIDRVVISWNNGAGSFTCSDVILEDLDGDFVYEFGDSLDDSGIVTNFVIN